MYIYLLITNTYRKISPTVSTTKKNNKRLFQFNKKQLAFFN